MVLRAFRSPDGEVASFANLWNHGGFFPTGMTGFLAGFQIALFAFVGIEVVGTTAAESRDPNKELPHAINTVPIRILLFYIGALAVIMMVTPWNTVSPDKSPFVAMFTLAGLGIAATVVNLVVITSAASSANSGLYSSARMVFGLSQEGNAPQHFNKLSRRGVPLRATCFTAVFLFASLALLYMGGSVMEAFTVVTTIGAFLFMVVWSLILASYIAFRRKYPERHEASKFKLPGGTAVCYMVFAFFIFGLFTLCLAADTRQALMFAPLFLIGLGIAWLFVRKSPKHQAKFQEFKQHIAR
jgi:D-serine/D-alanine/glycine transporter